MRTHTVAQKMLKSARKDAEKEKMLKSARKDAEKEKKAVESMANQAMKKAQEKYSADIKAGEKKIVMINKERDKERSLQAGKASKEKAEKGNLRIGIEHN